MRSTCSYIGPGVIRGLYISQCLSQLCTLPYLPITFQYAETMHVFTIVTRLAEKGTSYTDGGSSSTLLSATQRLWEP